MEDAIITKLNLQPGMSIFGVFDGHGGSDNYM
jgi:serine/threonine protein phosphatase PrpC